MSLAPDLRLLDTCIWQSLCGPHRDFSVGTETIRRYAPGFSPIISFAQGARPNWAAFSPYCAPGEACYCDAWSGPLPLDWTVDVDSAALMMVWAGNRLPVADGPSIVPLEARHADQMVDLATRTHPGPFGLRTRELGDFFGCFDNGRLIAMAGERFWAEPFREISGVCTDPAYQGRGLARRLMATLVARHQARGQTSFLHVMRDKPEVRQLYERLGFVAYRERVVRVITRH